MSEYDEVLPDNYPIYADYMYVVDGKPYRSDYHGVTVQYLKAKLKATTIKRFDFHPELRVARPEPQPATEQDMAAWRESISRSVEKELKEAEERKAKIASGEIILPDAGRPWEVWLFDGERKVRFKTARSEQALRGSIKAAELTKYEIAVCLGEDETTRKWLGENT